MDSTHVFIKIPVDSPARFVPFQADDGGRQRSCRIGHVARVRRFLRRLKSAGYAGRERNVRKIASHQRARPKRRGRSARSDYLMGSL
jgi:hypothetical protein